MTVVAAGGTTGRLVPRGLWCEVRDVDGDPEERWVDAAVERAAALGALELRVTGVADGRWRALGFTGLDAAASELALPVQQVLVGVEQTRALGVRLAGALRPGDLVVLSGPLGAGKTALTQGIGSGLGVRGAVTSPTFVLARHHRGPLPLLHVDAYRLRDTGGEAALDDLDLEQALEEGVVVIEWGEGLVDGLSDARLDIRLDRPNAEADERGQRRVTVRAHGARWSLHRP